MTFEEAFEKQLTQDGPNGKLQPHTAESIAVLNAKKTFLGTDFEPGDFHLFALFEKVTGTEEDWQGKPIPVIELILGSVCQRDAEKIEEEYDLVELTKLFPRYMKKVK
jgi:hypothetical protein